MATRLTVAASDNFLMIIHYIALGVMKIQEKEEEEENNLKERVVTSIEVIGDGEKENLMEEQLFLWDQLVLIKDVFEELIQVKRKC